MDERLEKGLAALKGAGAGSKGVAVLVGLALTIVVGTGAWIANEPEWERLYDGLDDGEAARSTRALSEGSIPFDVSAPPAPFVVYVQDGDRISALNAVALAGALEGTRAGIVSDAQGMGAVFLSAAERAQALRKREWEEAERMLETLNFVAQARVGTSTPASTPLGQSEPARASVTLELRGGSTLTDDQAQTVADLVGFRLGVAPEDLIVSDQRGERLWDGSARGAEERDLSNWLEAQQMHDSDLERSANEVLAMILGEYKAQVKIHSAWNTEQVVQVSEQTDPESRTIISEETTNRKTPTGGGGLGGATGSSANLSTSDPNFGVSSAGAPGQGAAAGSGAPADLVAKDDTSRREYIADRTTTQSVRQQPVLERLTVALFVDESIPEESRPSLEASVKAAVGFDEVRGDMFSLASFPFVVPPEPEAVEEAPEEEEGGGLVGQLLERGVEIVAAFFFALLAMRTLRGSRKERKARKQAEQAVAEVAAAEAAEEEAAADIDPLVLAREQALELVRNEPERVAQILSTWSADEKTPVGSA